MESMDNQGFDRKIKAKFDHFEGSVPPGLWDKIEQELDAIEQEGTILEGQEASISKRSKPIKILNRTVWIYGSIAAMFFIAFSFWRLTDKTVIYLESNRELAHKEPGVIAERETEGSPVFLEDESAKPVELSAVAQKEKSMSLLTRGVYADLKDVEIPLVLESTKNNALVESYGGVMTVESELTFMPTGKTTAQEEVFTLTKEHLELASQELRGDGFDEEYAVHEDIGGFKNKKIGVSTVLNFLAKGFSGEDGNSIKFSENEEGILQWDIKSSFAKNPK